jgi:hypothetical protein
MTIGMRRGLVYGWVPTSVAAFSYWHPFLMKYKLGHKIDTLSKFLEDTFHQVLGVKRTPCFKFWVFEKAKFKKNYFCSCIYHIHLILLQSFQPQIKSTTKYCKMKIKTYMWVYRFFSLKVRSKNLSTKEEEEELRVLGPGVNEVSFRARPHHNVHNTLGVDIGATGP